jgi:hypothetical protein
MKIQYWCSIGFGPKIVAEFDTYEDFGIPDEDWNEMSDEEKEDGLEDWAMQHVSYGIKEL